jgi:hypothetical protein
MQWLLDVPLNVGQPIIHPQSMQHAYSVLHSLFKRGVRNLSASVESLENDLGSGRDNRCAADVASDVSSNF